MHPSFCKTYWDKAQHVFSQANCLDWLKALPKSVRDELPKVAAGSDFVVQHMLGDPKGFDAIIKNGVLFAAHLQPHSVQTVQLFIDQLSKAQKDIEFDQALRRYRNRAYCTLIWRDLIGRDDLWQIMANLSDLADALIMTAVQHHRIELISRYGEPYSVSGQPQHLVTLAMGKLGAGELNLSSDVDLIFCYPLAGETKPTSSSQKSLTNQEFFVKLGQRVIKSLSQVTQEGFVFRVDMRLRPFGQSGALALNFNALETYYQEHGRPWERYALIKARPISADVIAGQQIMARLRPFVFRRYIDFGAIEELRQMKALINQEVARQRQDHNIKLGSGGIREVEFIAQAFQLIRGGQSREFQQRALRTVLKLLPPAGLMPQKAVKELEDAYVFLRMSEHRLQAVQDQQTHELPFDPQAQLRLAHAMDFGSWPEYLAQLDRHRVCVRKHFDDMVRSASATDERTEDTLLYTHFAAWWHEPTHTLLPSEHAFCLLPKVNETCVKALLSFKEDVEKKRLPAQGQERLDRLMPKLLSLCFDSAESEPELTLTRVLPIMAKILRRSAYIVLLNERPGALLRLLELCQASAWLAEYLMKFPSLLDELMYLPEQPHVPAISDLEHELRQQLVCVSADDLETQMEILRQFKNTHVFYAAVFEIQHNMPVDGVSRYLTSVAQVVVQSAFDIACSQISARFEPIRNELVELAHQHYLIVALGKMGSYEMSFGSDLDLIFVHDSLASASIAPDSPIDNGTFFTRLTQRLIHIFSTSTYTGRLYEIDTRLRPYGGSGLLVSTMNALEHYLTKEAWTWEHQALVRARPVLGSDAIEKKFNRLRSAILTQHRTEETLRSDILSMRQKMLEHFRPRPKKGVLHLKHDRGAIVDIEFIMQFIVLRWANQYADLVTVTDVTHLLRMAGKYGIVSKKQVSALVEAYREYRSRLHRLVLQNQKGVVPDQQVQNHIQTVQEVWNTLLGN